MFLDTVVLLWPPAVRFNSKVLIVRTDAIGDFVLWVNAAMHLSQHYRARGCSVFLLGDNSWTDWARALDLADEVWALDQVRFRRNIFYRWNWLLRVRRAGFGTAIYPVHSRAYVAGDAFIRVSGAEERIGSTGDYTNSSRWLKLWSDRWYSRLIRARPEPAMELIRNAEFMRGLGFSHFLARAPTLANSKRAPVLPPKPYAVLFPAAGWEGRSWPAKNFAEIASLLFSRGINIVLAGGPRDHHQVQGVLDNLSCPAANLVGKTPLAELPAILGHAVIVVANETSAIHIAAAVGTPAVCITGGGHYGRFLPYIVEPESSSSPRVAVVVRPMPCFGCNWRCIHPRKRRNPVKCIGDIATDVVWDAIRGVLG